mmetsp:Transcript_28845/g.41323  ORF Transcript_28845/g.41323 Transcript_28845/m.41323 type:complete len:230 (-) Transcript_28845:350-1039(-)
MAVNKSIPHGNQDEPKSSNMSPEMIWSLLTVRATKIKDRISIDTIRPLALFLGVSGPTAFCFSPVAFTPPTRHLDKTSFEKVSSRLSLNFKFFSSNYAVLAIGVTVVISLLHPGMLLSVAIVWGFWSLHHFMETNSSIPLNFMGKDLRQVITKQKRTTILTIFTVIVVIFKCLIPMLTVMFLSTILILFHALMRDPRDVENSNAFRGIDNDGSEDDEKELSNNEQNDSV